MVIFHCQAATSPERSVRLSRHEHCVHAIKNVGPVNVACSGPCFLLRTPWTGANAEFSIFFLVPSVFCPVTEKKSASLGLIFAHFSETCACVCVLISSSIKLYICSRGFVPVTTIPSLSPILKSCSELFLDSLVSEWSLQPPCWVLWPRAPSV